MKNNSRSDIRELVTSSCVSFSCSHSIFLTLSRPSFCVFFSCLRSLRVESFYWKLVVGIPRTQRLLYSPWQPLGIPSAITTISQLHQSPPSPIPGDLGRGPSHQSHVLEHRDTYGQAQVCSKGHQGSSVDRPCQLSFHWIKFWHVWNPLP